MCKTVDERLGVRSAIGQGTHGSREQEELKLASKSHRVILRHKQDDPPSSVAVEALIFLRELKRNSR
jgi:hypothetical protein